MKKKFIRFVEQTGGMTLRKKYQVLHRTQWDTLDYDMPISWILLCARQ